MLTLKHWTVFLIWSYKCISSAWVSVFVDTRFWIISCSNFASRTTSSQDNLFARSLTYVFATSNSIKDPSIEVHFTLQEKFSFVSFPLIDSESYIPKPDPGVKVSRGFQTVYFLLFSSLNLSRNIEILSYFGLGVILLMEV